MHRSTSVFAVLAVLLAATSASGQAPIAPSSDLSTLPTLGVSKADVLKFLDQGIAFTSVKDQSGIETLTGKPDDKTTVVFMCVGDQVVAASVTIPVMGAAPAPQDATKVVILLRTLMNIFPKEDFASYPFGQIFLELAGTENQRWITTIGELQLTGERARPGFLIFRVVNERLARETDKPADAGAPDSGSHGGH